MADLIEDEQLNSISQDLNVPLICTKEHIKCVLHYEKTVSFFGEEKCLSCGWVSNLLFDLTNFAFYNSAFIHKNVFSNENKSNSKPIIIWSMIYIYDTWFMLTDNKFINKLISMNGHTYEEIFNKSWGHNKLSILPKNQNHFFYKSIEEILHHGNKMTYIISLEKNGKTPHVNEFLKNLFPNQEKEIGVLKTIKGYIFFNWIHRDYNKILTVLIKTNSLQETIKWACKNNQLKNLILLFPKTKEVVGRHLIEDFMRRSTEKPT